MSKRSHGQLRRSQVITTYGPGALIDLPKHSAIVGGLDWWPLNRLEEIEEPRLSRKLEALTNVRSPRLFAPPGDTNEPGAPLLGIRAWRFPEWFVVQEATAERERENRRRLIHRSLLEAGTKYDGRPVVATRFVRACKRGHVDDIKWQLFVHGPGDPCRKRMWLVERSTGGDLADLVVRCDCGKQRSMDQAAKQDDNAFPLGACEGRRPWLGRNANEPCGEPARLLIRTATNAYFAQSLSVLSLPNRGSAVDLAVKELWEFLDTVDSEEELAFAKKKPKVTQGLATFSDAEVLAAIERRRAGGGVEERPVKLVELDALVAAPEGYGDDVPIDPDFHARRLPDRAWRRTERTAGISGITQLHRLREVSALVGFTRLDAVTPDIHGDYEDDVKRAQIAIEPEWFPAVENRGEGIFLQLGVQAVKAWLERGDVKARVDQLAAGHAKWADEHNAKRPFPGGPYVLLHTLSHLLIQSLAMRCGYPASSLSERIYCDHGGGRFGILLFTGSSDSEGTLGGLVQQARQIEEHLEQALESSALCSNDPICANHSPGTSLEARWLHGAACHGCALVAETSCEMRNDYLDRALVIPILGVGGAAFFPAAA
jgi:hypothetical protein